MVVITMVNGARTVVPAIEPALYGSPRSAPAPLDPRATPEPAVDGHSERPARRSVMFGVLVGLVAVLVLVHSERPGPVDP